MQRLRSCRPAISSGLAVVLLATILALLASPREAGAAGAVRVVSARASVLARPELGADVLTTVANGTLLDLKNDVTQNGWYVVWLPTDAQGIRRTGFITASDVEVLGSQGPIEPHRAPTPPASHAVTRIELEGFGGTTFRLPGAFASLTVDGRTVSSPIVTVLPTFGVALRVRDDQHVGGAYFDFSGVELGTASAAIGGVSATASGTHFDMHFGCDFAAKRGKIQPFADIAYGFYHEHGSLSSTFGGSDDASATHESAALGGGVRIPFPKLRAGLRVSVEMIVASLGKDPTTNLSSDKIYFRLITGFYRSF